jgi:hypothetical protein
LSKESIEIAEARPTDTKVAALWGICGLGGAPVDRTPTAGRWNYCGIAVGDVGKTVDSSRFDETGRWANLESRIEDIDDRPSVTRPADRLRSALTLMDCHQRRGRPRNRATPIADNC